MIGLKNNVPLIYRIPVSEFQKFLWIAKRCGPKKGGCFPPQISCLNNLKEAAELDMEQVGMENLELRELKERKWEMSI